MSAITWITSDPTDASNASAVDDAFRSLVSNFAGGIGQSFYWPGSGGGSAASAGQAKIGTARLASTNTPTGGYPDGFLALDATDATLFHNGSTHSALLGHAGMLARDSGLTFPQVARWLGQSGQLLFSGSTTQHDSFDTPFRSAPVVFLMPDSESNVRLGVIAVDASGFTSAISVPTGSPPGTYIFSYYAEGVVTI